MIDEETAIRADERFKMGNKIMVEVYKQHQELISLKDLLEIILKIIKG